ncbi:MAG TPA: PilZ domain-containing protein [Candidatus Sulfotelmatobacter sp.]|nr:PilZ domain-containing protein [Candidatus Sulfotelmatobacter sp.]
MTLSALLVCVDEKAAEVLRRVLKELNIRVESCPDFARAAIRTAQERFDVIIVDGAPSKDVTWLLRETRSSRLNDAILSVAVVNSQESVRELFSLGVNFVLYKPVAYERALSSLRAARSVMRKEKRRKSRAAVHTQAIVDYANVEREKATLVDLASDGMAVLFGKKLPPTSKVYFQFTLPGQKSAVRLSGQLVWQEWNGRAGVQFVDVPKGSRRLLDEFLAANQPEQSGREPAEESVELQEPLPVASLTVTEPTASNHEPESQSHPEEEPFHEVATAVLEPKSDTSNRRAQLRYACRLGAEVYLTGTAIPNRCCLTDLSEGGCYLEVPLPFPQGATVEIVVRTYELKLQLRGTVLTSHPGYGMGIGFELKTRDERVNVKKLTDFVAATTEPS